VWIFAQRIADGRRRHDTWRWQQMACASSRFGEASNEFGAILRGIGRTQAPRICTTRVSAVGMGTIALTIALNVCPHAMPIVLASANGASEILCCGRTELFAQKLCACPGPPSTMCTVCNLN
jgi:hypothetical protein